MKDVKKLLAEQANEVLPDERVKQNIKDRLGYTETEQYALAHGGTAEKRNKKIWIPLVAAALALALCLGILLPVLLNDGKPGAGGGLSGNKFLQIDSAEDFYIYGAASVGSLLAAAQEENASAFRSGTHGATAVREVKTLRAQSSATRTATSFGAFAAAQSSGLTDEEAAVAETVNGYMALVENLLGEGNIAHDTASTPADDTYAGQYAYKSVISYHDLLGGNVHYVLYYNTELTGSETDEEETEETFSITGLLVVGSETYEVRGEHEKEEESEPGESESESELTFTAYRTVENRSIPYISMRQEISSEQEGSETETEQKFVYTYYDENGRAVQSTTAEYEEENGDLEVQLTVRKSDETDRLLFRNAGSSELRVNARLGGQQYAFTVQILTDANGNAYYSYEFSDHHGNFDRFDDDDEDDEDDDDDENEENDENEDDD